MTVAIRRVERGDAAAIAAVHVDAWLAGYRGLMSDEFLDGISVETWEAWWREKLDGEGVPPVRVAVEDGAVFGFCITATPSRDQDTGDDFAEIVALNVSPASWRSGVGTALVNDALYRFREDGWQIASLWVADGNDRAQRLYRRFGFELDGTSVTRDDHGAREVRMRLPLSAAAD